MGLFEQHNDPLFPVDEAQLPAVFSRFMNRDNYFKGMFEDGVMVGWMLCVPGHGYHHSAVKGMSQLYYHSSLTGIKAARALVAFHQDFFEFAEKRGYEIVVTSSYLPNATVFEKLLSRAGWSGGGEGRLSRPTKFHRSQRRVVGAGRRRTSVLGASEGAEVANVRNTIEGTNIQLR